MDYKVNLIICTIVTLLFISCDQYDEKDQINNAETMISLNVGALLEEYQQEQSNYKIANKNIPDFEDLVYLIEVLEKVGDGDYQRINYAYYDYEYIVQNGTINISLAPLKTYELNFKANYMLSNEEVLAAQNDNLITEVINITNSMSDEATVKSTTTILNDTQYLPSFSFGKHTLNWMFGYASGDITPPADTVTFYIALFGPRLFDLNIHSAPINANLLGDVYLRFNGSNDSITFNIDEMPADQLLATRDYLYGLQVLYKSPSDATSSILNYENNFNSFTLSYMYLNINIPEIPTNDLGEFTGAENGNEVQDMSILFNESLYEKDTININ
ncbi:hypothetical protein V6R21_11470 [Limibacter armeniacum]|uniref:hypothetical protein n=1 Tax=Limibacter armeniacum TaxID=466084 RepID=UPI002FE6783C